MFIRMLIVSAMVLGGASFVGATDSDAGHGLRYYSKKEAEAKQARNGRAAKYYGDKARVVRKQAAMQRQIHDAQKQADADRAAATASQQQLKDKQDSIKKFLDAAKQFGPRL